MSVEIRPIESSDILGWTIVGTSVCVAVGTFYCVSEQTRSSEGFVKKGGVLGVGTWKEEIA